MSTRSTTRLSLTAALAALVATTPSALAAPNVTDLVVQDNGHTVTVSYRVNGTPLTGGRIEAGLAPDGTASGGLMVVAGAPTSVGVQTVTFDSGRYFADGRHLVRLSVQDGTGAASYEAAVGFLTDATPPRLELPELAVAFDGTFLQVGITAADEVSGVDLTRAPLVEVAPFSRERQGPVGPWQRLGEVTSSERGVGVDISDLADGQYLARVTVANTVGLLSRSGPAWFAKQPLDAPQADPPPTSLELRLGGTEPAAGIRRAAQRRAMALEGQLLGPTGVPLAGYRVTVRDADGRGTVFSTDADGAFRMTYRPVHGGLVRIRASRNGVVLRRDIRLRVLRVKGAVR